MIGINNEFITAFSLDHLVYGPRTLTAKLAALVVQVLFVGAVDSPVERLARPAFAPRERSSQDGENGGSLPLKPCFITRSKTDIRIK